MDKADQIAPLVAMLDRGEWTLPVETPDFAQDGFEPNAMFVHGPQLNPRLREGRRHLAQQRAQTRLEVRLRLGSAWTWRGRGMRRRAPSRRK